MKDFLQFHTAASGVCAAADRPRIVAAGVFDGVHLGHRAIVRAAKDAAAKRDAIPAAVSFTPHPRCVFAPDQAPALLMPEAERVRRLRLAGAAETAFIVFDREVAMWTPEEFLEHLAANRCFRIAGICVGEHWRFGRDGSGDGAVLERFCAERNWSCNRIPEVESDGEIVSSSGIRRAAAAGDLAKVRRLTGSPLTLYGRIVHGFQVAGTELAAPTANLELTAGVMPPDGVYAGQVALDGAVFPAAVNLGFAPTFHRTRRRIEIHLVGFSGTLYGRELAVELLAFLRPEREFSSPAELKRQIAADIARVVAVRENNKN
ncbi:MAG: riboflavin biosynthesis protein RibF [Lentisphaeria bacterium]|nr:riboflavin biosynthesis protein RibF [Lentisphaeria bacterium]